MKKIFDSEVELTLVADTQESVVLQERIMESIGNPQMFAGVIQELDKKGAIALPAIIRSTFVIWKELEKSRKIKDQLLEVAENIAKNNEAARGFLFQTGIQNNPFHVSRKWLIETFLKSCPGRLTTHEKKMLNDLSPVVRRTSDESEFIPLYFMADPVQAMFQTKRIVEQNVAERSIASVEAALVSVLAAQISGKTDAAELIGMVCREMAKDREGKYAEFRELFAKNPFLLDESRVESIVSALDDVLQESHIGRNSYIEWWFLPSVAKALKKDSGNIESIDKSMRETQWLGHYWFQGLAELSKKEIEAYFHTVDLRETPEDYIYSAMKQDAFQKIKKQKNINWLDELVEPAKQAFPDLYEKAENDVGKIKGANINSGASKGGKGAGGIAK